MIKTRLKLVFDIMMTVIWVLLMKYAITGLLLHEILGLAIMGFFILHKCFNFKWIKGCIAKCRTNKLTGLVKAKFITDIILFVLVLITGVTGILISVNIFTFINVGHRWFYVWLHNASAYASLIVISIHVGLSWNMIMGAMRKLFGITKNNTVRNIILKIAAALVFIAGVKSSFDNKVYMEFVPKETGGGNGNGHKLASETFDNEVYFSRGDHKGHGDRNEESTQDFSSSEPSQYSSEDEYLGTLTCTGCGKHCCLLTPQCGTGQSQASSAREYYQENLAGDVQDSSDENSSNNENNKSYETVIVAEADDENMMDLFLEIFPIMGMFIAGTHYSVKIACRKKK